MIFLVYSHYQIK